VSRTVDERSPSWETPGIYQVASGIYRVPLPLPGEALRAVNVYVIEDGDGLFLIDLGQYLSGASEALESALGFIGHDLSDVRECFVTHIHRDHYTQAVALRRQFGSRVSLGVNEAASMALIQDSPNETFPGQYELLERCGASAPAPWAALD
jgi:glyoxylase-like metal-dependent hydrolase (beta-lactamase superfamily II)